MRSARGDRADGLAHDLVPVTAELAVVARALRTRGFEAAVPAFDRLASALLTHADTVGADVLAALTRARDDASPIAIADLLDGIVAPRLGLEGSIGPRAEAPGLLHASEQAGRSRAVVSSLDPEAEAAMQLAELGEAARGPIAVLGGAHSGVLVLLAALATPAPLLCWDPCGQGPALSGARRPFVTLDEREVEPLPGVAVWIHPALRGPARRRAERLRARLVGLRAARRPRLDPRSAPLRIAVLVRTRPFHLDAPLTAVVRTLGHPTAVTTVHGDERDEAAAAALVAARPDLVVSVNGAALVVAPAVRAALEVAAIPTVLWFVDDPDLALGEASDLAADHVLAFAWERAAVARLRARGFRGTTYLPHGARWSGPPPTPLARAPELLWIGSSYAGPDRLSLHAGAARPDPRWRAIEQRLRSDRRLSPGALVAALPGPASADRRFAQLRVADRVAAERRAEVARALLPLGLTIFGDVEGWRSLLRNSARLMPDVDAVTVAPYLVGGARISVDCAHPQMPTAVTQRVFDVPAYGGLVLADDRPDLRDSFEAGAEILAYDSPAEAVELARWALAHPESRSRIVAAARRRVLGEHLLEHRVRRLLHRAAEHFGGMDPGR